MPTAVQHSVVLPTYSSGDYYATHADPAQDDRFKAAQFLTLLQTVRARHSPEISSYADVGCGSGGAAAAIRSGLTDMKFSVTEADAYDISPHVLTLNLPDIRFHMADFCSVDEHKSLVTLFDVVEHVPDPCGFLRAIAQRCDFIGLHIPLDRTLANCLFDRFHHRLRYPGHISIWDIPTALNMVTMAGLTPIDYRYTPGYAAPSGTLTWKQKAIYPLRSGLTHLSPWLAQQVVGGISLMVFAATTSGLGKMTFDMKH